MNEYNSRMRSDVTLEVWRLESCSLRVVLVFAAVRERPQHVRNEVAKPHHWAALTKCDQDDVLEVDILANSVLLLRFVTCGGSVCVLRGRCNTLGACQC